MAYDNSIVLDNLDARAEALWKLLYASDFDMIVKYEERLCTATNAIDEAQGDYAKAHDRVIDDLGSSHYCSGSWDEPGGWISGQAESGIDNLQNEIEQGAMGETMAILAEIEAALSLVAA